MNRYRYMLLSILIGLVVGAAIGYFLHSMPIGLGVGFLGGVLVGLTRNR